MRPPSACACPASKRPDLPDASPQRAEAGAVPCGKYSSTLRRVLKYLAESTVPHSARQHPAFRDGTGGNGGDASSDRDDSPTILIERQNQNNMRTCILLLLMLFLPGCAEGIRAGAFSPDTFRVEFALYGQTRRFAMKFEPADDSVAIRWSMPRHGKVYGGTYRLQEQIFKNFGINFVFADLSVPGEVEKHMTERCKMVFFETPTNPMLRVADIRRIAAAAKAHGAIAVVDNTFLTPYFQRPLALGADLVLYSATKFLCGHHDTSAGIIVSASQELAEPCRDKGA